MNPRRKHTIALTAMIALALTACSSPEANTAESFLAAAIIGEPTIDFVSDGYLAADGEIERNMVSCEVTGSSPVEGSGNPVAPQRVELDCPDGSRFVTVELSSDGKVYRFHF
jgi:hypothetical protein